MSSCNIPHVTQAQKYEELNGDVSSHFSDRCSFSERRGPAHLVFSTVSDTMTCAVCHKNASDDIVIGTKILFFYIKKMQNVRDGPVVSKCALTGCAIVLVCWLESHHFRITPSIFPIPIKMTKAKIHFHP